MVRGHYNLFYVRLSFISFCDFLEIIMTSIRFEARDLTGQMENGKKKKKKTFVEPDPTFLLHHFTVA